MKPIHFLDLAAEHEEILPQLQEVFMDVIHNSDFIQGKWVKELEEELGSYFGAEVIGVANGTDALQIAFMALEIQSGDEVIIPGMTYYATAEAASILGIVPVVVDVDIHKYTLDPEKIEAAITDKTKAIVPVHLYGQPAEMEHILRIAKKYGLFVIEDTAQAFGAKIKINNRLQKVGSIGDIGTLSFFPGKNLGAMGDGGAVITKNPELAKKIRMIANHGQSKRYIHDLVGCNSRLDSLQAAILLQKLPLVEEKNSRRVAIAEYYSKHLAEDTWITLPKMSENKRPVYHQYTIRVHHGKRNNLQEYLEQKGIPTRVYYPLAIHQQRGVEGKIRVSETLPNTEMLTDSILSLPIHPMMEQDQWEYITINIKKFGSCCK